MVTLTFKAGEHVTSVTPQTLTVTKGAAWASVKNQVKVVYEAGYEFAGWTLGGAYIDDAQIFMDSVTLVISGKKTGESEPAKKTITIKGDAHIEILKSTLTISASAPWSQVKTAAEGTVKAKTGYKLSGWKIHDAAGKALTDTTLLQDKDIIYALSTAKDDIIYTVKHLQQSIDGKVYTPVDSDTQTLTGTADTDTKAAAKNYPGFTAQPIEQKKISGDGTTLVEIKYDRKDSILTFDLQGGSTETPMQDGSGGKKQLTAKFGAPISVKEPTKENSRFAGWKPALPSTFPAENTEYQAQWKTIPLHKVSFQGSDFAHGELSVQVEGAAAPEKNPVSIQVADGKNITITAVPNFGYTVEKWEIDGAVKNGTKTSYTHTVAADVAIIVTFKLIEGTAILTVPDNQTSISIYVETVNGGGVKVTGAQNNIIKIKDKEQEIKDKEQEIKDKEQEIKDKEQEHILAEGTQITLTGSITFLQCQGGITALELRDMSALSVLDCSANQLTSLMLQGCSELRELNCSDNQLSALDIQGLNKLTKVNCSRNQITTPTIENMPELQDMDCSENGTMARLTLKNLPKLEILSCALNQMTSLTMTEVPALKKLVCLGNKLINLDVQGLQHLEELDCRHNQIADLNITGASALKSLSCFRNNLNEEACKKVLEALPPVAAGSGAACVLFEESALEKNHQTFESSSPAGMALKQAKDRHWKIQKKNGINNIDL